MHPPLDSHGSISSKRAIFTGEVKRAISRSTDAESQKESLRIITRLFVRNGYPKAFVKATIKRALRNRRQPNDKKDYIYLKLPFVDEEYKRRALAVVRRTGLK